MYAYHLLTDVCEDMGRRMLDRENEWEMFLVTCVVDILLHPLYLCMVRMQAGRYKDTKECVLSIYAQDGLYGFYKGWTASLFYLLVSKGLIEGVKALALYIADS